MTETAYHFLKQIAGDGTAFLRFLHAGTKENIGKAIPISKIDDIDGFNAHLRQMSADGFNVWAMVSEGTNGRSPIQTRLLWADMDWDKYPAGKQQVESLIAALPVQPSWIVETGHGTHLYWFLDRAVTPDTAKELSRSLIWRLGGDAKHAPNTLMRVPGTINPKHLGADAAAKGYTKPTECLVVGGNNAIYSPNDFPRDKILEKLPYGVMLKLILGPQMPSTADRSAYDFEIVMNMLENGIDRQEIGHLLFNYPGSGKAAEKGNQKKNYITHTLNNAIAKFKAKGSILKQPSDVTPVVWQRKTYQELLEAPRPAFLVQDFLPHAGLGLIAAPPKARKSWAAMQLAHSMATGASWLGFNIPEAKKVLYVQAELPDDVVAARFEQMYSRSPVENLQFIRVPSANLTLQEHLQGLLDEIQSFGAELVIIDPVANFWQGDENSASSVNALFDSLAQIQELGCGVVLVHHSRKTQGYERLTPQHMRGSSVFFARPDAIMTISPTEKNFSWADFTLRAAAPRDAVRLFVSNTGEFTLEGKAQSLFDHLPPDVRAEMEASVRQARQPKPESQPVKEPVHEEREAPSTNEGRRTLPELQIIQFNPDGNQQKIPRHGPTARTGVGMPGLSENIPPRPSNRVSAVQVSAGD